jgi:hypothetical protein
MEKGKAGGTASLPEEFSQRNPGSWQEVVPELGRYEGFALYQLANISQDLPALPPLSLFLCTDEISSNYLFLGRARSLMTSFSRFLSLENVKKI